MGLIEWTLFKIGGRFEFFLLWLLFSRSHALQRPFFASASPFLPLAAPSLLRLAASITHTAFLVTGDGVLAGRHRAC